MKMQKPNNNSMPTALAIVLMVGLLIGSRLMLPQTSQPQGENATSSQVETNIDAQEKADADSQVKNNDDSQVEVNVDSQNDTETSSRVEAENSSPVEKKVDAQVEMDSDSQKELEAESDKQKEDSTVQSEDKDQANTNNKNKRELTFRNHKLLSSHYEKHGKDMGFESKEEYEKAAANVVNNPEALHKTEAEDGDDVYYVESTNEFVIVSKDGYIRTYFLPDAGKKYYDKQ